MTDKITKAYNTIYRFCTEDGASEKEHVLQKSLKIIGEELGIETEPTKQGSSPD